MRKDYFRKGMIFLIIAFFLLPNGVLSEEKIDEEEIIEDPFGDVFVFDSEENLTTTDEKPNIDIEKITYSKADGSDKVTLTIEVYGEIEDKGDPDMESSFELVYYAIQLITSNVSDESSEFYYEVTYINKVCQVSYPDSSEMINITDFSVAGGILTISFDLQSTGETYESMVATTLEIDSSLRIYMDIAPNEPMSVDAGGPYWGEVGDDIEFSGIAYLGVPPYTYEWDFGDDETATGKNPVHSYESAGNYTVTLTVTDDAGSTANDTTTATIIETDTNPPNVEIIKPEKALYIINFKIRSYLIRKPFIIGKIDITVDVTDDESGMDHVEFYIDDKLKSIDISEPFSWTWKRGSFIRHRHIIKTIAYDNAGNSASDEITVWKFF